MTNLISRLMFVALVSFCLAHAVDAQIPSSPRNILAVTEPWPPYMGPDLEDGGFLPELLREVFRMSGDSVRVDFLPWDRTVHTMKVGQADAILGVYQTAARDSFLAFSSTIFHVESVLFGLKGRGIAYESMADLKPYAIGVVKEAVHGEPFDSADLNRMEATSTRQNIDRLMNGHIDLLAGPRDVVEYIIRKEFPMYVGKTEVLLPALGAAQVHIGFSKAVPRHTELLQTFEDSLQAYRDGRFRLLAKKHGITVR